MCVCIIVCVKTSTYLCVCLCFCVCECVYEECMSVCMCVCECRYDEPSVGVVGSWGVWGARLRRVEPYAGAVHHCEQLA